MTCLNGDLLVCQLKLFASERSKQADLVVSMARIFYIHFFLTVVAIP